jgi:hypothetical protein
VLLEQPEVFGAVPAIDGDIAALAFAQQLGAAIALGLAEELGLVSDRLTLNQREA